MTKLKMAAYGLLLAATLSLPGLAGAQSYDNGYSQPQRDDNGGYAQPRRDYDNRGYHHRYRHYDHYRTCGADARRRGNNGTAIGAVSGGVLGGALGGGKFGNVLLGAGAGAVAGHEIGRHTTRC